MNTKFLKKSAAVFFAAVFACAAFADKDEIKRETINIWPKGQMAGMDADKVSAKMTTETPRLSLYLPKTDKKTGFMIICPGGGYGGLASGHEGTEIAEWLADEEIPCAILHYRVPNMPNGALMDIQRAIKLVRSNAEKWNIDPNKIAIMGFSAGANLCARASTQFDTQTYTPVDAGFAPAEKPLIAILFGAMFHFSAFALASLTARWASISAPSGLSGTRYFRTIAETPRAFSHWAISVPS